MSTPFAGSASASPRTTLNINHPPWLFVIPRFYQNCPDQLRLVRPWHISSLHSFRQRPRRVWTFIHGAHASYSQQRGDAAPRTRVYGDFANALLASMHNDASVGSMLAYTASPRRGQRIKASSPGVNYAQRLRRHADLTFFISDVLVDLIFHYEVLFEFAITVGATAALKLSCFSRPSLMDPIRTLSVCNVMAIA